MKTITSILSFAALTTIFLAFPAKARENVPVRVTAPTGLGTYTEKPVAKVLDADIYVSPTGDDSNSGDISHPLRTIDKARSVVRRLSWIRADSFRQDRQVLIYPSCCSA